MATVSRVLNNANIVSPTTRTRVEDAIKTLKFVPSSSAQAINSGRTHLIGALIPTLDHAIFARFIDSIEAELTNAGLSLIVATTGHDTEVEISKANRLLNLGVEGLIVSGLTRARAFKELVDRHQVPVISTSYFDTTHEFPTIGYDNAGAAKTALDHLQGLGHTNIAVLSGPYENNDRQRARLSGLNITPDGPAEVFETGLNSAEAATTTLRVHNDMPSATAFLCLSDVVAQGVLLQLRSMNIQVPSEYSIVGIDDLPSSASFDPPLTSVYLPAGRMGIEAARRNSTILIRSGKYLRQLRMFPHHTGIYLQIQDTNSIRTGRPLVPQGDTQDMADTTFGPKGRTPRRLGSLDGKTYVITGGNAGVGFQASRILLSKGGRVIMLNRSAERSDAAVKDLKAEFGPDDDVGFVRMDLSDQASVRAAAEEVLKIAPRIDAVLCNAAIA